MTNEERDIQRKLKVLQHAEKIGNARKACRYFGVGRSSFYRWRYAYQKHGEAGLKNAKSIPKNPANQTLAEIVETAPERLREVSSWNSEGSLRGAPRQTAVSQPSSPSQRSLFA